MTEPDDLAVEVHDYDGPIPFGCVASDHDAYTRATKLISVCGRWSGPASCNDEAHVEAAKAVAVKRHLICKPDDPIDEVLHVHQEEA